MTWYPLTEEDQCTRCGGLPAGNELIGQRMGMFPGSTWKACQCAKVRVRGKSTGRTPIARTTLSERPLTKGWTVCWEGTEGSCRAVAKRLVEGTYRPDLAGTIEVIHAAHDVSAGRYLVLWKRRST